MLCETGVAFTGVCLCVGQYVCVLARVCVHLTFVQLRGQIRARKWCWEVVGGCGRLQGSISCFLATVSLQMNDEAANDVDPKY